MRLELSVNGEPRAVGEVCAGESLLTVLRDSLGLTGTKNACEQGECGACSVYLDGVLVCSCLVPAGQAAGADVVTVEGLAAQGRLDPVQEAFAEAGAIQCGFCTPGLAAGVSYSPQAAKQLDTYERAGFGQLPVCIAKTHLSISSDPALKGAPAGWTLPVREVRASTGAGFVYPICGDMRTMPGLSAHPAAAGIDLDEHGEIVGLF